VTVPSFLGTHDLAQFLYPRLSSPSTSFLIMITLVKVSRLLCSMPFFSLDLINSDDADSCGPL